LLVDVTLVLVGLLVIAVIIAVNGYFVAQEFAYMAVDRTVLKLMAEKGDRAAARALRVTGRTSFMLSGAQLGITITGLLVGYVAEPLVGNSVGKLLGEAGMPLGIAISIATVGTLVIASVVQMIFGELFPKNLAIAAPTQLSRSLAASTLVYLASFGWLISFFDKASNALLRLIKVEPVHDFDSSASAEDLEYIVEDSRDSGDLPEELFVLLDRILDFPEQDVEHAMVPRSQADFLSPDSSISEARQLMAQGHTRYPVIADGDDPVGVILLADVLQCEPNDERPVTVVMRPPLVIPTPMRLPDALEKLIEAKSELACVIDEYGGFVGLLTIEDLGEELVGDVRDEHDGYQAAEFRELAHGRWRLPSSMPIDELERLLGEELPVGDWETLSGLLIAKFGGLPAPGDLISVVLDETPEDATLGVTADRVLKAKVLSVRKRIPAMVEIEVVREEAPETFQVKQEGTD
jgi:CBS domain containing-hemolysin-like protein